MTLGAAQVNEVEPPIERIASALIRAANMITTLQQCYDAREGGFVVGHGFVVQAILAMEGFITDAQEALTDLAEGAPALSIADQIQRAEERLTAPPEVARASHAVQQTHVVNVAKAPLPEAPVHGSDGIAKSYDELLRKLTAAEVFAQEQQAILMPGTPSPLVPLLRGLREDLRKVQAA